MNFVFDIGNVLLHFRPIPFLESLLNNPELEEKMFTLIFRGREWTRLDEGTLTQEEAHAIFREKEPAYRDTIDKVMANVNGVLAPIPEAIRWLERIKEAGHGLFYLSNMPKEMSEYIVDAYPFFSLFDGGVFSCDVKMLKPSSGIITTGNIYLYFLDKYRLAACDCVFFDDMKRNVEAAGDIGMSGVFVRSPRDIECALTQRLNLSEASLLPPREIYS